MRLLRENLSYKILALALSVALWANVKLHQEPFTTAMPLPLQVRSVPEKLVAVPSVSQVTVVLYGPKVYVSRLVPDQLKAYVNLADVTAGHVKEEVAVEMPANLKPIISIQSVTPDKVDVRLFQKRRKTVPVRVSWEGTPVAGARYGSVRLDPVTVDVAGAEHVVAMVDHAEVSLQAGDPHITGRFPVVPVDASGTPVSDVRIWPDGATVDATLTRTQGRQQALVSPAYRGNPIPGYGIEQVWTEPQVVTVLGPQDVIRTLTTVQTRPIDITGAKGDLVRRVPLQTPRGVTVEPDSVQVRIRIRKGANANR